jgi:predicted nucleic acid-binding protein
VLLLDAGVWVAATDEDDRYHVSSRAITVAGGELAVLDLTLYEVANVVTSRFKTVAPATAAVHGVLAASGQVVHVDDDVIADTVGVAIEHGLTAYDAAYVAVARRYGWTLVSTDIKDLVSRELAVAPDDPSLQDLRPTDLDPRGESRI